MSKKNKLAKGMLWAKIIKPYEGQQFAEEYVPMSESTLEYINQSATTGVLFEKVIIPDEALLVPTGLTLIEHFIIYAIVGTEKIKGVGKKAIAAQN